MYVFENLMFPTTHLRATVYLPRAPTTSDSVALRNAQLEAMGVEVPEPKRNLDRKEVATDDVVSNMFPPQRCHCLLSPLLSGHGEI